MNKVMLGVVIGVLFTGFYLTMCSWTVLYKCDNSQYGEILKKGKIYFSISEHTKAEYLAQELARLETGDK